MMLKLWYCIDMVLFCVVFGPGCKRLLLYGKRTLSVSFNPPVFGVNGVPVAL